MPQQEPVPSYDDVEGVASLPEKEYEDNCEEALPKVKIDALLGKRLVIFDAKFQDSQFDTTHDGVKKQFAIVEALCPDKALPAEVRVCSEEDTSAKEFVNIDAGTRFVFLTGRVRMLDRLRATEKYPVKGEVQIAGKTKSGYDLWDLVPW